MELSRHQQRQHLRRHLRQQRRALTPAQQQHAAQRLAQQLHRLPNIANWRHIGLYWPDDGEIDPSLFARALKKRGARLYLPVIGRGKNTQGLNFLEAPAQAYRANHRQQLRQQAWPAKRNRYGMREPVGRRRIRPQALDAILMPLVGFDASSQRLGMGGGFYDRLLASLMTRAKRPRCIGLAHHIQQLAALPEESWDQPADSIVTDAGRWHR